MRWKTNGNLFLPTLAEDLRERKSSSGTIEATNCNCKRNVYIYCRSSRKVSSYRSTASDYLFDCICMRIFSVFVAACFDRFIKLLMHYTWVHVWNNSWFSLVRKRTLYFWFDPALIRTRVSIIEKWFFSLYSYFTLHLTTIKIKWVRVRVREREKEAHVFSKNSTRNALGWLMRGKRSKETCKKRSC